MLVYGRVHIRSLRELMLKIMFLDAIINSDKQIHYEKLLGINLLFNP